MYKIIEQEFSNKYQSRYKSKQIMKYCFKSEITALIAKSEH